MIQKPSKNVKRNNKTFKLICSALSRHSKFEAVKLQKVTQTLNNFGRINGNIFNFWINYFFISRDSQEGIEGLVIFIGLKIAMEGKLPIWTFGALCQIACSLLFFSEKKEINCDCSFCIYIYTCIILQNDQLFWVFIYFYFIFFVCLDLCDTWPRIIEKLPFFQHKCVRFQKLRALDFFLLFSGFFFSRFSEKHSALINYFWRKTIKILCNSSQP